MRIFLILVLCFTICLASVACSANDDSISASLESINIRYTDSDNWPEAPEDEYYNICEFLNRFFYAIDHSEYHLSERTPYTYKNIEPQADQASRVNLYGVPVILQRIENLQTSNDTEIVHQREFLASVLFAIWRINEDDAFEISGYNEYLKTSPDPVIGIDNISYIKNAYEYVKTNAPKIISSEYSVEEKIKKLRICGILALPYVFEEIKNGHTEYEAYFYELGLHLTVAQYMDYIIHSSDLQTAYLEIKENELAEGFDYSEWLRDKAPYLRVMFKYLDELCSEYEAEQNK